MLKKKLSDASAAPQDHKKSRLSDPDKSKYFPATATFEQQFLNLQLELNSNLAEITFEPPVAYIYNPLEYAFKNNETYVRKFCKGPKDVLFVGMNPGPFGMCQTGVPFGEIKSVRDWLNICEEVGKPPVECPKRPIQGFACPKTEVSGDRFWNLFKKLCGTPENLFRNCFVYNYCPLAMMRSDGANLTPRDIKDHQALEAICDATYVKIVDLLQPKVIVAIGEYIEKRTRKARKDKNKNEPALRIVRLAHPSPRSLNNQNWPAKAEQFLRDSGLTQFWQ